jgi:hypothetical protein
MTSFVVSVGVVYYFPQINLIMAYLLIPIEFLLTSRSKVRSSTISKILV